jgi:hypothetical protein
VGAASTPDMVVNSGETLTPRIHPNV